MKQTCVILVVVAALLGRVEGSDPPAGFEQLESVQSPGGGFQLVTYIKPPGDSSSESQIWLEPIKTEFKKQLLFTFTNRAHPLIDATDQHIAIAHHANSSDNLLWLFVRKPDGSFHKVPQELRATALKEFTRQTHIHKKSEEFDHFDCYPDSWLEGGQLRAFLSGDSIKHHFYLKPWYFIYDVEHERFVPHDFPNNKQAFVSEKG